MDVIFPPARLQKRPASEELPVLDDSGEDSENEEASNVGAPKPAGPALPSLMPPAGSASLVPPHSSAPVGPRQVPGSGTQSLSSGPAIFFDPTFWCPPKPVVEAPRSANPSPFTSPPSRRYDHILAAKSGRIRQLSVELSGLTGSANPNAMLGEVDVLWRVARELLSEVQQLAEIKHAQQREMQQDPAAVAVAASVATRSSAISVLNSASNPEEGSADTSEMPRVCQGCQTRDSPEWRRGPDGKNTLCNACGLRYARRVRMQRQAKAKLGAGQAPGQGAADSPLTGDIASPMQLLGSPGQAPALPPQSPALSRFAQ